MILKKLKKIFTKKIKFNNSSQYWEDRYKAGGNSGPGSYSKLSQFKADVINNFVVENRVQSVVELGCGDGNQLGMMNYPQYLGVDVSETILDACRNLYQEDSSKSFIHLSDLNRSDFDLALSLDVIFHLVEDQVFEDYMRKLFLSSKKYVIIYSSNKDDNSENEYEHVKHRRFSDYIDKNLNNWSLVKTIENKYKFNGDAKQTSFADFYVYQKN